LVSFILIYIYFTKLHIPTWPGWSFECLFEWKLYLRLALPGFFLVLLEWLNYEIATFLSGTISVEELGVMAIVQQILLFCYIVN
jgi:multidrug resistance protein, MATE family